MGKISELDRLEGKMEMNNYNLALTRIQKVAEVESKELSLEGLQLDVLPPELWQLSSLTQLDLSLNNLAKVPIEIGQLTGLTHLILSANDLTQLPPEIGQLTRLTYLNLSSNNLTQLPPEIGRLTYLTELNISANNLTHLPPMIGQLTNLTYLCLSNNHLACLPYEIYQLTGLTDLNLSVNNLTCLPPEICQLTDLIFFDLSNNNLTELPVEIRQLRRLNSINLTNNPMPKAFDVAEIGLIEIYFTYLFSPSTASIPIPEEFRVAFKQYLVYFNHYVHAIKGHIIALEIRSEPNGLIIELAKGEVEPDTIWSWLKEYANFIKISIENVNPIFEIEVDPVTENFEILNLRNQVRHCQRTIMSQKEKIQQLEGDFTWSKGIVSHLSEGNRNIMSPNIQIEVSAHSHSDQRQDQGQTQKQEVTFNLSQTLPKLQDAVAWLREGQKDTALDETQDVVDRIPPTATKEEVIRSGVLPKIKRLIQKAGEAESGLSKALTTAGKGVGHLQNLAKHYNSIAEWCGMPVVPKPFLGEHGK